MGSFAIGAGMEKGRGFAKARVSSLLIQINGETQGVMSRYDLIHPYRGREQHDKEIQASWIDRNCRALYGSSVVAPLLVGESAIRIP
jgi:hypothetical protein